MTSSTTTRSTTTSLKKAFTAALIPLVLAGALAGCAESSMELAHKPELIGLIKQNSIEMCEPQQQYPQAVPYEVRLDAALRTVSNDALQSLIDNNVTVCLDQRLEGFSEGWSVQDTYGVFYNQDKDNRVLSLWDNGRDPAETGFFTKTVQSYSEQAIEKLKGYELDYPAAEQDGLAMFGYFSCGKSCTTMRWNNAGEGFWSSFKSTINNNPDILRPPVMR